MKPSENKPIFLLLAVLIVGGLTWWIWPRDASEAEPVDEVEARELRAHDASKSERRSSRVDLAHEAKASASGTVRSFGGGPIADAQVCADAAPSELRGLGDGQPKCTRTGPDGHWQLDGLWPVSTRFSASAAAHEPKLWRKKDERGRWDDDVTLTAGSETKGIDFELKGGGVRLAGVVKDLGGGEIEGARVQVGNRYWFGDTANSVAISDAEGRFELWVEEGTHTVTARAEGYAEGETDALAPSERVELFLTPESVLVGHVVHAESGEPIADATVHPSTNQWFGVSGEAVRSDAEGRFRIGGLKPGVYKPTATRDDVHGTAAVQVHLGLAQTSEEIEIRVHPMSLLEGRVVIAGTDEGCRSGNIVLTRTDENERKWSELDDEGRVSVRALRPGEYRVQVNCEGMVARDDYPNLVLAGEDRVEQVWEVREGQAIRGKVVDSKGEPVVDAHVSAQMLVDAESARAQTTNTWGSKSEEDGSFELGGLLPGRYEVSAYAEQPSPDAPIVVELPVGSDHNDLRIELLATGTITGRVVDEHGTPQPGVHVEAGLPGKWGASRSMTDDQGNFEIEHVRTGEIRVKAATGMWSGQSMRAPGTNDDDVQGELVEVIADETVEVELRVESRTGVIRGKVFDEHGSPVDDAYVHAERMSDSATANAGRSRQAVRWDWDEQPTLSEVDGTFTIDELSEGTYVVRAYRRGGGEAIVENVALGSSVELTITATGVVSGTVVVPGGKPPEKFSINAQDRAQGLYFGDEFFRTEGKWELSELPAGKYTVSVDCGLGNAQIEVELEEGANSQNLELKLTPLVTIRGRLIDIDTRAPIAGMEVNVQGRAGGGFMLMGEDAGERKHVSDAEGRFEVERVPTGKVDILAIPRGFGSDTSDYTWAHFAREVPVEPAIQDIGDLELVAKRLDPEEVAGDLGFELQQQAPDVEREDIVQVVGMIRPTGPAAATELAVGDVIETVDGKAVSGADASRYYQLTNVPPGTAIELGIKDGKKVTITAGPPLE